MLLILVCSIQGIPVIHQFNPVVDNPLYHPLIAQCLHILHTGKSTAGFRQHIIIQKTGMPDVYKRQTDGRDEGIDIRQLVSHNQQTVFGLHQLPEGVGLHPGLHPRGLL